MTPDLKVRANNRSPYLLRRSGAMLKFILDALKGALRDSFDLDGALLGPQPYNRTREGAPLMSVTPPPSYFGTRSRGAPAERAKEMWSGEASIRYRFIAAIYLRIPEKKK